MFEYPNSHKPGHKRTTSNPIESLKVKTFGHRRAISNKSNNIENQNSNELLTDFDSIPQDSLNSPVRIPKLPKKKSFIGLLNAAVSYFEQETENPLSFSVDDSSILIQQKEKLLTLKLNLEQDNKKLSNHCKRFNINLEKQKSNNNEIELSTEALRKYSQHLEKSLNKATSELKFQQNYNENLNKLIIEGKKDLVSNFENFKDDSQNKHRKLKVFVDTPKPQPINYKPISQKELRSSRELKKRV